MKKAQGCPCIYKIYKPQIFGSSGQAPGDNQPGHQPRVDIGLGIVRHPHLHHLKLAGTMLIGQHTSDQVRPFFPAVVNCQMTFLAV